MSNALPALNLEYKPDAQQALARIEAWWHGEILDRPAIQVWAPRPADGRPVVAAPPPKQYATLRDRWMDVPYVVERAAAHIANSYYAGEAFPQFNPNLGPEVMTAGYGAELIFSESTSWSIPILKDWHDTPKLKFDPNNVYISTILDLIRAALEAGKGKFLVGHTDMQGTLERNQKLARERAASVVAALTKDYGIKADRLTADGVGPLAPVASNSDEAGRAKNRRVEMVLR